MASLKKELEKNDLINKSNLHVAINTTFVFISVTVLTFIISVKNEILKDDWFLAIQLALSIPLFIYTNIARSRVVLTPSKTIDNFGSWTYTFGFIFFLNSSAILISMLTYSTLGVIFMLVTIGLMLTFEMLVKPVHHDELGKFKIKRWIVLLAGFVLLGLLHIIRVY